MTNFQALLWLCTAAYAIHVLEEFVFNWQSWARNVLGLAAKWEDFYVTNALVIVLGIVAAEIADTLPAWALAYPALMLINATFFHVAPFALKRGRFSPGLITAVLLFYPLGALAFRMEAGAVSDMRMGWALLGGAVLMAYPIVLLKLKSKPYFDQDRPG